MIRMLDELSRQFKNPTDCSVTRTDINMVTGDYKKEAVKFTHDVHAALQKKKHNNVILIAITY